MANERPTAAQLAERKVLEASTNIFRNNITYWFKRYGVLKDREGREIRYNASTGAPGPTPTVTQQKMFDEYTRCRRLKIPCKMLILKPRQNGASTGAQAILYFHLRSFLGRKGALMADITGSADKIFEHFRMFATNDDFDWGDGLGRLRREDSLRDDITLPGGSVFIKETANSTNAGRGGTIQAMNMSEVAFFPPNPDRDPALAFLGSWTKDGESCVGIMDSTPNGPSGTFYTYWTDERNGFAKLFTGWFEEPTARMEFSDEAERKQFTQSMDEDERDEMERFGVSLEQLKWRRRAVHENCGGDPDKFRQEFPSDPIECFLRKSRARFSISILEKIEAMASSHPPQCGSLTENDGRVTFYPDDGGSILVYEQPRYHCRYVIGFDSCTGRDQQSGQKSADPDEHAIKVWREGYVEPNGKLWPPKLCAQHTSQLESETAVQICAWLSRWYGNCLVVPEVNGCGLYPTKKLIELGVPVFYRQTANKQSGTLDGHAGWMTNEQTRKELIDFLGALIARWTPEKPTFELWDKKSIQQYKKFIVNRSGRPEAMQGEHDDCVFGDVLALFNKSAATEYREPKAPKVDFAKMLRQQGWALQPNPSID